MALSEKETLGLDVMEAFMAALQKVESEPPGTKMKNRGKRLLCCMVDEAMSGDEKSQRKALADLVDFNDAT